MSLNSQYLVVFNNPRDQQQITVLARQMYPGQSEKFLNTYRTATSKPFGYLLIDLKPDTLNDKRLWPNVFQQTNKLPTAEQPYFYYSEQKAGGSSEEQTEPRSHLNFRNPEPAHPLVDLKTYNRGVPPPHFQFSKEPLNVEDMASIMARASCDECGVLFETLSYLTCKIMFAIGVTEDLTERDLDLSQKALRMKKMTILPLSTWLMRLKKKQKNDLQHMLRNTKQMALR